MSDKEESVFLRAVESLERAVEKLSTTVEKHSSQLAVMEERHNRSLHVQVIMATIGSGLFCGIGVYILDHLHLH